MLNKEVIIQKLPYSKPFLFVDHITSIHENGVEGRYTFLKDEFFYQGHFKDNPVTPGVILTECMAQIGLACLGIHICKEQLDTTSLGVAMSSTNIEFYKPVFPGDTVTVISEKEYFRFHKLKCNVAMYTSKKKLIAKGTIAGMIKPWNTDA